MVSFIAATQAVPSQCVPSPAASCDDQIRFDLIKRYAAVIQPRSIWKGRFKFHALPLYIVHWDGKTADRGFLINPPAAVNGATPLPPEIGRGMRIQRYDGALRDAEKIPNQLFDMPFNIGVTPYFLMLYKDWDETDIYAIPAQEWIRILLHESFHMYQFNWVYPAYGEQNEADYPYTSEIIALSLLELNIASAAFKTKDKDRHRELLKMYTAVRTRKIEADPSGKSMVKRMDNVQEYLEGSAKYFEVKVYEQLNPKFAQEHYAFEIDDALDVGFQTAEVARGFFTFGMWYFTGAIVLSMLDNLDIPFFLEMEKGATPYDISRSHFRLSAKQNSQWLDKAKKAFKFNELVKQADRYLNLR